MLYAGASGLCYRAPDRLCVYGIEVLGYGEGLVIPARNTGPFRVLRADVTIAEGVGGLPLVTDGA